MQVSTKQFAAELQWIQRFIEKKTTIPILSNVLFEADGPHLTLTATDLEMSAVADMVIDRAKAAREKWSVAAPVAKLIKYLEKVDEPEVTIATDETHQFTVTHGRSTSRVSGMSHESFPELPIAPTCQAVLSHLPMAIGRAAFAISAEESRFTLNGALLEVNKKVSHLVATDGHRLSLAPVQSKLKGCPSIRALLPKKALLKVAQMEGDCAFSMDDDFAFFSWGQRRILCRKLTGNFPDYTRVMGDGEYANHVMLPVSATRKVLDRVSLYADERSHAVTFVIEGEKLTIKASTVDTGAAEGSVLIRDGIVTEPYTVGYNADYVTEFLARTEAQFVSLCWNNATVSEISGKSVHHAAQFVTGDSWKYLLMPMRNE